MNKFDLKIGIFSNKFLNFKYETTLKKAGFKNIFTFNKYGADINTLDILYIDEQIFERDRLPKHLTIVLMVSTSPSQEKYKTFIELGIKDIIFKSASNEEILLSIETVSYLKLLEIQNLRYQEELQKALKYKDYQEHLALKKQIKIIKDDVSMKKFGNFVVNTFFKPKDILSGDSYLATRIGNKTFFVIADAMGKGLSASISAILSVSFISYKLKTKKYSFKEIVTNTVEYIKTILLEDEALCISFLECNSGTLQYANFSLPPLYYKKNDKIEKIKSNNLPITKNTDTKKIEFLKRKIDFDLLLMYTDGIIETVLEDGSLLFSHMEEIIKKNYFLNEIIKDVNKLSNKKFDDDLTIIGITNDNFEYKKIYSNEYIYNDREIDTILENLESLNLENKAIIDLILVELLLNIYEHQNKFDKDHIIKKNKKIENLQKVYAKIRIYESEKYIKIVVNHKNKIKFNISELVKEEGIKKYSGRGIFTMNFYANALAFNNYGNEINIYIRRIDD